MKTYDPSNAGFTAQYGASIHNEAFHVTKNGLVSPVISPLKGENDELRRQYNAVKLALGHLNSNVPPTQYDHMRLQAENAEIRSKLKAAKSVLDL